MSVLIPVFKLPEQLLMVASVEAPFALLEEPVEALFFDAIESTQMTLGLIPEVFNAINVVSLVGEELGVVDSHVAEVANVESIVGLERIVIDDTVGLHFPLYDRQDGRGAGIGYDGREDLSAPLRQPENRHLAGSASTSPALAPASEVALVGLHLASELVAWKLAGCELAEPHEETGRGPGDGANNEQFNEFRLLANAQSTLPFEHYCYPKLVA